ncbi:MAG TPA: hypothetical protein VFR21_10865, partial [Bradyrhizobium sp.]|nr:hypothetical protein [Bradyrhizobium sp.]
CLQAVTAAVRSHPALFALERSLWGYRICVLSAASRSPNLARCSALPRRDDAGWPLMRRSSATP